MHQRLLFVKKNVTLGSTNLLELIEIGSPSRTSEVEALPKKKNQVDLLHTIRVTVVFYERH